MAFSLPRRPASPVLAIGAPIVHASGRATYWVSVAEPTNNKIAPRPMRLKRWARPPTGANEPTSASVIPATVSPMEVNRRARGEPAMCTSRMAAIGGTRLKVVKRIVRCAAVNVDPDTAVRDLAIPQALQRRLGHGDCGIYAEVTTGGTIAVGDAIMAEQPVLL